MEIKEAFSLNALLIMLFMQIVFTSCKEKNNDNPGLKDLAGDKFLIGAALNTQQIEGKDTMGLMLVKHEFNTITSENILKPMYIQPEKGKFNFDLAETYVRLGEENNMFIIGHTLVWHNQTPGWMFLNEQGDFTTRDSLLARMENHISTFVGHFKGRINGWDVVNEAVNDDGSIRKSKYYNIIGEDYIQKAFEYAQKADPSAELYYNDYSLTMPAKRDGVIRLVKDLMSKGVKIDGIGMQAHYDLNSPDIDEFEKSIIMFAELGVKVMITEMDISVLPSPYNFTGAEISKNFELQAKLNPYTESLPDSMQDKLADRYAEFFKVIIRHSDKISRLTFWGVSDKNSWKNNFPVRGRTDYTLIFDRQYQPKPAYFAIRELLSEN